MPPELAERVHVERQVIGFPLIDGDGRVDEAVELDELVDVPPHSFVVGVEDVRAVLVDDDAALLPTVAVAADVGPLVDDQTALPSLRHLVGEDRTEQAGPDNQVIVLIHIHAPS